MKYLIATILLLTIKLGSFATEWDLYYIYIQRDYIEGTWLRADLLDKSDYKYLHPKQFGGYYGMQGDGLAEDIVTHLKEETPNRYKFQYNISVLKDTVIINTTDSIADFDAVKNELTASFIMNNFNTVTIIQKGKALSFHLEDISVPYMDLVFPKKIMPADEEDIDSLQKDSVKIINNETLASSKKYDNKILIGLIISIIGNLILGGLLLGKKRKAV